MFLSEKKFDKPQLSLNTLPDHNLDHINFIICTFISNMHMLNQYDLYFEMAAIFCFTVMISVAYKVNHKAFIFHTDGNLQILF